MARPSLFPSLSSTPSSLPEALSQACSGAARANEFARWLTTPPAAPLRAPESSSEPLPEKPSLEPPKARVIEVTPDAPGGELSSWLGHELRPRGSVPPDSLAPQVLPPEPPASNVSESAAEEPASASAPDLDMDDLAVLPGRARRARRERRGGVVALALLLLAGGVFSLRHASRSESSANVEAEAAAPLAPAAALPPPPPEPAALEEEPEPLEIAVEPSALEPARKHARAAPSSEQESPEPVSELEAALRAGGPSVRRFADLPLPTLSKLAREEGERLKQRDAAVRSKTSARN